MKVKKRKATKSKPVKEPKVSAAEVRVKVELANDRIDEFYKAKAGYLSMLSQAFNPMKHWQLFNDWQVSDVMFRNVDDEGKPGGPTFAERTKVNMELIRGGGVGILAFMTRYRQRLWRLCDQPESITGLTVEMRNQLLGFRHKAGLEERSATDEEIFAELQLHDGALKQTAAALRQRHLTCANERLSELYEKWTARGRPVKGPVTGPVSDESAPRAAGGPQGGPVTGLEGVTGVDVAAKSESIIHARDVRSSLGDTLSNSQSPSPSTPINRQPARERKIRWLLQELLNRLEDLPPSERPDIDIRDIQATLAEQEENERIEQELADDETLKAQEAQEVQHTADILAGEEVKVKKPEPENGPATSDPDLDPSEGKSDDQVRLGKDKRRRRK